MPAPSQSEVRRLHAAAIPVWAVENLKRLGIGLVGILAVSGPERFFLLALAVVGLIAPVIRYLLFSYRISEETLVVQGGLVPRWRRVIPVGRIQSVDRVQKLRHRAFGVVQLRIEAAGGSGTEADLVAVSPAEAERIRRALLERGPQPAAGAAPPPPLVRLGPRDLVLAGITGGRVAVLAAMLAYLQETVSEDFQESLFERIGAAGAPPLIVVAIAVTAFVIVSLIVSIVATVFAYWDFTLGRQGERLIVSRGLLEQRRSTIPLRRVQAVVLHENLLRRALGLASLSVVVAGYAGPKEEQEETSMLLPIAPRSRALAVAAEVLGISSRVTGAALVPAPRRAAYPRAVRGALYGVLAGIAGALVLGWVGALAFLLCIPGVLVALGAWRALGHAIVDAYAIVRSGWWVRRTSLIPLANVQELKLTRGPVQHLARLASVRFRVPKAQPAAYDLDEQQARARFASLAGQLVS